MMEYLRLPYLSGEDSQRIPQAFSRAISLDNIAVHAYANWGELFKSLGRFSKAIKDLEHSLGSTQLMRFLIIIFWGLYKKLGSQAMASEASLEACRRGLSQACGK